MGCCKCCCCCILITAIIVAASLGLFAGLFPYPTHASCEAQWTFGKSCSTVQTKLTEQVIDWNSDDCSTKQQCRYQLLDEGADFIRGSHSTPLLRFTDHFNFTFSDTSFGCKAVGNSRSDAWYALLDFGTNYCNLKNLITGSKLYEEDNFYTEDAVNANCTMYSIAYCHFQY